MNKAFFAHCKVDDSNFDGQPLSDHLLNVGKIAYENASKGNLAKTGYLIGLLHDLGKYRDLFQNYLLSAVGIIKKEEDGYINPTAYKGKINHSFAGGQYLWNEAINKNPKLKAIIKILSLCIISHHSGLKDCIDPEGKDIFLNAMDNEKTDYEICSQNFNNELRKNFELNYEHAIRELNGILNRINLRNKEKDIQSNKSESIQNTIQFQIGVIARFLLSCLLDADQTDTADYTDARFAAKRKLIPMRPWERLIAKLDAYLNTIQNIHPIDTIRQSIGDACFKKAKGGQGLYTLTVPTGGGKTLSSLRFALHHAKIHNLDRIIYIIPYTSIIDQNADIFRKILEEGEVPGSIVLEHHSSYDYNLDENISDKWEMMSETWDAPIIVTTMVQFLETVFGSATRSARRMHNIARSVLIFDEIQTIPLRCLRMFCNVIEVLYNELNSTILLCTATQINFKNIPDPLLGSLDIKKEHELITDVSDYFRKLKRTNFFIQCQKKMSLHEIIELLENELYNYGSCLVICNTKKEAENIYQSCDVCDVEKFYLSTNLCAKHRMEILTKIRNSLKEKKKILCVSTQLIECGVDLSFASVIRIAAGLDSILQAAGRCNRHGEYGELGRVHVILMEDENLSNLPSIKIGQETFLNFLIQYNEQLEKEKNDLNLPVFIDLYFRSYLHQRESVLSYFVAEGEKLGRDDTLLNMLGSNVKAGGKSGFLRQSFFTASHIFEPLDSASRSVIVPYNEEARSLIAELSSMSFLYQKKDLLRKSQRYSVNLYKGTIDKLFKCGALREIQDSGILVLQEGFYSDEYGVVIQQENKLLFLDY